jgi:hypothetical protein
MKTRLKTILAKIESSYAVDPTPTGAANAIVVSDVNVNPISMDTVPRDLVRNYLGNSEYLVAAMWKQIEFTVEIAGAGGAGTVPKFGPLLRACGMGETINGGVSVVYSPISAAEESVTIYANIDGMLHKGLGCRGTVSLTMNARQRPTMRFTFIGLFAAVTDAAAPSLTLTGWQKPVAVNNTNSSSFTLHSYAAKLSALSIDLGVAREYRNLVGAEDVLITDRQPAGSITIEQPTVAQKDYFTTISAATLGTMSLTHGPALNRF